MIRGLPMSNSSPRAAAVLEDASRGFPHGGPFPLTPDELLEVLRSWVGGLVVQGTNDDPADWPEPLPEDACFFVFWPPP